MDFSHSEEQQMIRDTVRAWADNELKEHAPITDKTGEWPTADVQQAAEMGLMGVAVPEQWDGAGMDNIAYAIAVEEISRQCANVGVIVSVQNSLVNDPLKYFGSDAQKEKYLKPLARGEKIGCFAITEPQAGTDVAGIRCTAKKDGDKYILNGTKVWITCGGMADTILIFATLDPSLKHKGHCCFIVEKDFPGFSVGKLEEKLGLHGSACCELIMEDCEVPAANLLGGEGEGFKVAMHTLDGGRIGIAAQAVGIAQGALDCAVQYAKEREAFGKPISKLQAIQWMVAEMQMGTDAARLLTYQAAYYKDHGDAAGKRFSLTSAEAKLHAARNATAVAHSAMQIYGGYGYSQEYPVERYYREARITEIYEGTNEVQKLVISGALLR